MVTAAIDMLNPMPTHRYVYIPSPQSQSDLQTFCVNYHFLLRFMRTILSDLNLTFHIQYLSYLLHKISNRIVPSTLTLPFHDILCDILNFVGISH